MKKNHILFFFYLGTLLFASLHAVGQFVWTKGNNTINQLGVYGTQGVYDAANKPGARWGATTWKDTSGIFWLFGGEGYAVSGGSGRVSDLWKYNSSSNEWMWVKGPNTKDNFGTYGTKGTATAANNPGAREVAVNWIDNSGNMWIMGGFGYAASGSLTYLNDLWKYDPATNQWTWMSGDSTGLVKGVYGTKGTAAAINKPGGRYHSVGTIDASGNLLMFSGSGYAQSNSVPGSLNDLWKYDIAANQWTWLSGDSTVNQVGVYGTMGTAAASNKPGARVHSASWTDASGNFWIFSGFGRANISSNGYLNDLFRYDFSNGYWTWMSGDNVINQTGVYNDSCAATSLNKPGGRQASVFWRDPVTGLFWLYGGQGRNAATTVGQLDDLWAYDISSGYWSWVRGSSININGVYGTLGVPDWANKPGGRNHPAGWNDSTSLWLFGGSGYPASGGSGSLNDLWKLPFGSPCNGNPLPVRIADFAAKACNNNSQVKIQWTTYSEVNNAYFTVERLANGIQFEKLLTVAGAGNSTVQYKYETVDEQPLQGVSYYRLASTSFDGNYKIESKIISVYLNKYGDELLNPITVFPNPVSNGNLNFRISNAAYRQYSVELLDITGKIVFTQITEVTSPGADIRLHLPALVPGLYFICITDGNFFSHTCKISLM